MDGRHRVRPRSVGAAEQRPARRTAGHDARRSLRALLRRGASRVLRAVLRLTGRLRIDGRRQLAVTAYCVHTFFDAYLASGKAPRLNLSSPLYPEIERFE